MVCSSQIPKDKQLHLGAGFIIGSSTYYFAQKHDINPIGCYLLSLGTTALAGGGKELYDELKYNGADWGDFKATMIGGLIGAHIIAAVFDFSGLVEKPEPYMAIVQDKPTIGIKFTF